MEKRAGSLAEVGYIATGLLLIRHGMSLWREEGLPGVHASGFTLTLRP